MIQILENQSLVSLKYIMHSIIQLLVFEETIMTIYRCVKGDFDRLEAEVNITFHTPIQNYCSVSRVWLILSIKVSFQKECSPVFIIFLYIPFENLRTTKYILKINVFYYHKNKMFSSFKRKNTFIRK